jgi:hypothetical protein
MRVSGTHLSAASARGGAPFNPNYVFRTGAQGVWYDPSDFSTLFQDAAGTTPVTAVEQPVGRMLDKSGRGNHATQSTLTSRPILGVQPSTGVRNILNGSATTSGTTYWLSGQTQNGITQTKVAQGIDTDGLPFCDYRFTGTATNNFMDAVYSNTLVRAPATPGQTFTVSAFCQLIGGTAPAGAGLRVGVVEETAPGTYLGITTQSGTVTSTQSLHSASRTISTGNQTRIAILLSVVTGETVDVTYRIKAAPFEVGSSRSAFQFSYSRLNITEPGIPGLFYLDCDGIDDGMATAAIDFTGTDKVTVVAGVRKLSDATVGIIAETGLSTDATPGTFAVFSRNQPGYTFVTFGSSRGFASVSAGFPSPDSAVLSGVGNIAADTAILRRNGSQIATGAADQGTGNYANLPLFLFRRNAKSLPFNGRFYGLVIVGSLLNDSQLSQLEQWINRKTGAF